MNTEVIKLTDFVVDEYDCSFRVVIPTTESNKDIRHNFCNSIRRYLMSSVESVMIKYFNIHVFNLNDKINDFSNFTVPVMVANLAQLPIVQGPYLDRWYTTPREEREGIRIEWFNDKTEPKVITTNDIPFLKFNGVFEIIHLFHGEHIVFDIYLEKEDNLTNVLGAPFCSIRFNEDKNDSFIFGARLKKTHTDEQLRNIVEEAIFNVVNNPRKLITGLDTFSRPIIFDPKSDERVR